MDVVDREPFEPQPPETALDTELKLAERAVPGYGRASTGGSHSPGEPALCRDHDIMPALAQDGREPLFREAESVHCRRIEKIDPGLQCGFNGVRDGAHGHLTPNRAAQRLTAEANPGEWHSITRRFPPHREKS